MKEQFEEKISEIKSHLNPGGPTLLVGDRGTGKTFFLKCALEAVGRELHTVDILYFERMSIPHQRRTLRSLQGNVVILFESIERYHDEIKEFIQEEVKNPDRIFFGTFHGKNQPPSYVQKVFPRMINFSTLEALQWHEMLHQCVSKVGVR